jgi:hypothetical protein
MIAISVLSCVIVFFWKLKSSQLTCVVLHELVYCLSVRWRSGFPCHNCFWRFILYHWSVAIVAVRGWLSQLTPCVPRLLFLQFGDQVCFACWARSLSGLGFAAVSCATARLVWVDLLKCSISS